ncbi:MAG: histidinol dehydrogenase [Clostridiaceae bacterium]|jgi:histidinol dehydrogenase|nr:histidinol dehydrogenase [Clostridiaceae bacterium]
MRNYSVICYTVESFKNNANQIIELAETDNMMEHALVVKVRN